MKKIVKNSMRALIQLSRNYDKIELHKYGEGKVYEYDLSKKKDRDTLLTWWKHPKVFYEKEDCWTTEPAGITYEYVWILK